MGRININIPREDRLEAINNLSKAIYEISKALNVPVYVTVSGCNIHTHGNNDIGISVDMTDENQSRSIVEHINDDENKKC